MKRLKVLAVVVFSLVWTTGYGQTNIDQEVISAVIKREIKLRSNDTIVLVVNTISPSNVDSYEGFKKHGLTYKLPTLDSLVYLDFIEKNKASIQIDSIVGFQGKIIYLSNQEVETLFKPDGWRSFNKKLGQKSIIKISSPGMNKDRTIALIYFSTSRGFLSAVGFYLYLEKIDGKWIVISRMFGWIA